MDSQKNGLVILDLETTGVDAEKDRIVEIGMIYYMVGKYNSLRKVADYNQLINPGMPIPEEASAVHGITDEDVLHRPKFSECMSAISSFISSNYVAGYNIIDFDLPLLQNEFRRCDFEFGIPSEMIIDAFSIYKRMEPKTLQKAHEFYVGEAFEDAHTALADSEAVKNIICEQIYYDTSEEKKHILKSLNTITLGDNYDLSGKLIKKNGEVIYSFGKHQGKSVFSTEKDNLSYLKWCFSKKIFDQETVDKIKDTFEKGVWVK